MAKFQKNFAPTATTVGVSQSYSVVAATDSKVVEASKKFGLNMKETAALTMLIAMAGLSGNANAAEGTTFALDVTSTVSFNTSNILWEFDDDADLGFTISKSAIVRLSNGKWVALVPNGYGSSKSFPIQSFMKG